MAMLPSAYWETCCTVGALLDREQRPKQWALNVALTLPEGQQLEQDVPPPGPRPEEPGARPVHDREAFQQAQAKWEEERREQLHQAARQQLWFMARQQPDEFELFQATVMLRLPPQVTTAVLEQLHPRVRCTHAELMTAIQRPAVAQLLLEYLRQAAQGAAAEGAAGASGSEQHMRLSPDIWRCMGTLMTEAARLSSAPLLDHVAAIWRQVSQELQRRRGQAWHEQLQWREQWSQPWREQWSQQREEQYHRAQVREWLQDGESEQHCEAARAPLLMAARTGNLAVLQLAVGAASGGAASPGQCMLRAAYRNGDGPQQLVQVAIEHDQAGTMQLMIDMGGQQPDAALLVAAVRHASVQCVRTLLAYGPFEVPPPAGVLRIGSHVAPAAYSCPLLAALQERARKTAHSTTTKANAGRLLVVVEALLAAGYRPTVYENVRVQYTQNGIEGAVQTVQHFDPLVEDPGLDLQGANRWLWLAAQDLEWSCEEHQRFLPQFRRAVRAFLLVCHRCAGSGAAAAHCSASHRMSRPLPPDVVQHIIGLAARPLSAWTPGAKAYAAQPLAGSDGGCSPGQPTCFRSFSSVHACHFCAAQLLPFQVYIFNPLLASARHARLPPLLMLLLDSTNTFLL